MIVALAKKLLSSPRAVFSGIAGVSALSLAAALTAEVAFKLEPCMLCIYQRIPFVLALIISLPALSLRKKISQSLTASLSGICSLLFLANSGIAFFHSGVERHWWKSPIEGCAVPPLGDNAQTILENILSAPTSRCDEIPWADPILGLSMANYNVVLCLALSGICLAAMQVLKQHPSR